MPNARSFHLKNAVNQLLNELNSTAIDSPFELEKILAKIEKFLIAHARQLTPTLMKELKDGHEFGLVILTDSINLFSKKVFMDITDQTNIDQIHLPKSHIHCANFFNNLCDMTINSILAENQLEERIFAMQRQIAKMQKLFNLGDYLSASAILFGLNNASISRLSITKSGLSLEAQKIYAEISEYLQKFSKELFENRESYEKPIVPSFSYYKHIFTQAEAQIEEVEKKIKIYMDKSIHHSFARLNKKKEVTDGLENLATLREYKDKWSEIKENTNKNFLNIQKVLESETAKSETYKKINSDKNFNRQYKHFIRTIDNKNLIAAEQYQLSKHLEKEASQQKTGRFFKKIRNFIVNNDTVLVGGQIKNAIEQKRLMLDIEKINAEISACFTDIKSTYSRKENHKEISQLLIDFEEEITHVSNAIKNGVLQNIDYTIQKIDKALKNKNLQRKYLSKLLLGDSFIISQLKTIYDLLLQEKALLPKYYALQVQQEIRLMQANNFDNRKNEEANKKNKLWFSTTKIIKTQFSPRASYISEVDCSNLDEKNHANKYTPKQNRSAKVIKTGSTFNVVTLFDMAGDTPNNSINDYKNSFKFPC